MQALSMHVAIPRAADQSLVPAHIADAYAGIAEHLPMDTRLRNSKIVGDWMEPPLPRPPDPPGYHDLD